MNLFTRWEALVPIWPGHSVLAEGEKRRNVNRFTSRLSTPAPRPRPPAPARPARARAHPA